MYRIPEIPSSKFLLAIKPLYSILEGTHISKSKDDPFTKSAIVKYCGMSDSDYRNRQTIIQKERAISMSIGRFHQMIIGSFRGWNDYGIGHSTGCDIGSDDGMIVGEVKNNEHTMNSDGKKQVLAKLRLQKDLGKRVLLVIINGNISHTVKDGGVEWISGRTFYQELSGRADFMDDLLLTFEGCIEKFKTYAELEANLSF